MERVAAVLVILFAVRVARGTPCEGGYYRELGCTPVYPEDKTCPIYYTCPNLHPDPTKCFYKGVSYNNEDLLPDSVVKNPCSVACYCDARAASGSGDAKPESSNQTRADWQTSFQCAAVDCVEDFTGEADAGEECVSTYAAGACCSSGKVCGKDAIAKLATCEVDGKTYREGQQFFPSGTCLSCLCTAQFNGTFEGAPYCRDIDCGIEIHSQMEIANKCAPVVMSGSSCCPHKWECPDNSTAVVRGSEASRVLSAQQARCQFGATSLAVGDSLTVGDKCIECSCRMPPLVSCVQQAGGVSYNNEDLLPDSVVKNPCSVACYCDARAASGSGDAKPESSNQTRADWQTSFQCAAVDCVEDFTGEADAGEECVSTYAAGACCSSGKVCGKDAIAKLATCEVDGKTYREGQQFFPSGTCLSCLCTAQFNGTFEGAPYCRDIDCGIEIHSQMEIANKCAPVVMSGSSCCPHKWECPDNSTAVVRGSEASRVLSAQQARCQFGATSLAVGDSLTVGDKCIECSCRMPPLVSCVQQAGCEN